MMNWNINQIYVLRCWTCRHQRCYSGIMSLNLPSLLVEINATHWVPRRRERSCASGEGKPMTLSINFVLSWGIKHLSPNHSAAANSQQKATRARSLVQASGTTITRLRHIYNCARTAMVRLGASTHTLDHHISITRCSLRVSTAIQDPRVTNDAIQHFPWIWTVDAGKRRIIRLEWKNVSWHSSILVVISNCVKPILSPWHYGSVQSYSWPLFHLSPLPHYIASVIVSDMSLALSRYIYPTRVRYHLRSIILTFPMLYPTPINIVHFFHFTLCIVYRIFIGYELKPVTTGQGGCLPA